MTKLEYKINQELKQIEHFHKIDSPVSVVSNKRDYDIRKDMRMIAKDARNFSIGVTSNRRGDIGTWANEDVAKMAGYYKAKGLEDSTIINYVSSLRSFLFETKRTNITASNGDLGLKRVIEYKDKSLKTGGVDINKKLAYFKEKDINVFVQLKLAEIAGLRREESIHAGLALAKGYHILKNNTLELKGSWCKNGRPRNITLSDEKAEKIRELQKYATGGEYKMDRNLKQEKNHLSNSIKAQGFNMHAVRHSEAQERYAELTAQGKSDKEARQIVSEELGHGRIYVTKVYLNKDGD